SEAAWSVGLLDAARRFGEQWRDLAAQQDSVAEESAALRHLARVYWERGDADEQWSAVAAAEKLAEQLGPSEGLAAVYVVHAEACMLHRQSADALEWADRALTMIDEIGARALRPRALVNKGSALTDLAGRGEEGAALLEEAIDQARTVGDVFNHS